VNQKSCAAVVVDGYTSVSRVGFVKNGVIVDELTDILKEVIEALQAVKGALVELDNRVRILEHE
jgi:hypothetical protein